MIDISMHEKADVLRVLYNSAKTQGMGVLNYDPTPMTVEEAEELLTLQVYFDYVNGRIMKVDLSDNYLDPWLYDRDNGDGAAERAIAML